MFQPSYFKQQDTEQMLAFVQEHPLASIVTMSAKGLLGNHIPMLVVKRNSKMYLQGHVAKANVIHQDIDTGIDALAMFQGPNGYISPNWYATKQKDPRAVPTWNYVAVHVCGQIQFFDDQTWLQRHLSTLSNINETKVNETWKITDAPVDYIDKMRKAIIGVEIEIKQITGNTKMSQNHPQVNRDGVVVGLKALENDNLAKWVEKPNPYK